MRTKIASGAFGVTVLMAVGFGWALLTDRPTQFQGLFLALALGGLALGLALWATTQPAGPYVEVHDEPLSSVEQQDALATEFTVAGAAIRGARMTRRMVVVAMGALGGALLLPVRSLLWRDTSPSAALGSTPWDDGAVVVDEQGRPVRAQDLQEGSALTVFPEGQLEVGDAPVILVRVDPARLSLPPERREWVVDGVVGYSKICTHAGCPVGLFAERATELLCPCHQSTFDVLDGARPVFGPAARALPQLPLGVAEDGTLVARGPIQGPVGPGYWRQT